MYETEASCPSLEPLNLEAGTHTNLLKIPCSLLQGIFPVGNFNRFIIRSRTPQQAAGNALAIAGQI